MKISLSVLVLLFAATFTLYAQKEVTFKIKMLPNHKYNTMSKTNMNMEMNLNGDAATMEKMKATGQKFPILMTMQTATNADIKTGGINPQRVIPYVMKVQMLPSKMIMNGVETPIPTTINGETIYGTCAGDYKLSIDSIAGKSADAATKDAMKKMMEGITANIEFPNKPMKVGETFIQNTPMDLPIAGMAAKMVCKITYKLISVAGNSANFDMAYDMTMDMTTSNMNIKAAGTGNGKLIYDMTTSYATSMTANMDMGYTMPMPQAANMSMTGKMKMTNEQLTTITTN